jgi:hypothetical protein
MESASTATYPAASASTITCCESFMLATGACVPTSPTTLPRAEVRLYAGAVEATAMTMLEMRPSAPTLRPFWTADGESSVGGAVRVVLRLSQVFC